MQTVTSLPPRGIFVPTYVIFHPELPAAVLVTWIQLRCLAWEAGVTPPLSMAELASITGIHPARLHRHVSQLQAISSLSLQAVGQGKIRISFPKEPQLIPENHRLAQYDTDFLHLNSSGHEIPALASYFPKRILGYLSYENDDEETFSVEDKIDPPGGLHAGLARIFSQPACSPEGYAPQVK